MTHEKAARKEGSGIWRLRQLLFPAQPYAHPQDKILGGVGAFAGVLGLVAGSHFLAPQLAVVVVASMGASAVLFFAAPHSPLAQPWPFVGGHLLSAVIGVASYMLIPDTNIAAATAVSLAIVVMHFLHCLHPPGGATALMAVVGGKAVHDLGFGYVLAPVGVNVVLFLTLALVVNNLLVPRRRYPASLPSAAEKQKEMVSGIVGKPVIEQADLEQALKHLGVYIDVSESDLQNIYSLAQLQAQRRALGEIRVSDIMQRDVPSCVYGDDLETIWELMRVDRQKGVPVIDSARRVTGIVTIVDFLKRVEARKTGSPIERLAAFIRRSPGEESNKAEVVGQIMSAPVITVRDDAHVVSLIPLFAEHEIHHLPVVDAEQRLVGMVTQSELLSALHRRRSQPGRPATRAS